MWQGSLQTGGELDMSDCESKLVDVMVIDSAVNRELVDVNFERVDEVSSVGSVS